MPSFVMLNRNLIFFVFFFAKFHSFEGCTSNKNKITIPCKEYDLSKPTILKLGDALTEISGISFYAKDSSVFGSWHVYVDRRDFVVVCIQT